MARYKCPQCGRRFRSVGEMLDHTERVHANAQPYVEAGTQPSIPARGMPSPEPGPVATERASRTDFEVEPQREEDVGTFQRGPMEAGGEEDEEKQSPALGTLIALVVIAVIIILNIIGGSPE